MAFEAVPGVSDGDLIRTDWGDAVSNDISNELIRRDGAIAMTGDLTLRNANPTATNHAVRKKYVDDNFMLSTGGTINGALNVNAQATSTAIIIRSQVTGGGGAVVNTPVLGLYNNTGAIRYGYVQGTATQLILGCDSGTTVIPNPLSVTGAITANAQVVISDTAPTSASHATRKDYIDNNFVSKAGELMTGSLSVGSTPTGSANGAELRTDGAILSTVTTGASPSALPNMVLCRTGTQPAAVGGRFIRFERFATTDLLGSIDITSGGVDYNETSDYRLKDDLGPIDAPLDRLMQLQPKHLRWKIDNVEFDGFIAHEVQAVAPYAVTGDKDAVTTDGGIDPQQLSTGKLIALLVAAVQELSAKVDALEAAT